VISKIAFRLALASVALLAPAHTMAAQPPSTSAFAKGLVELARREKPHDPRLAQTLLGVTLRNPQKWTGQPDGTLRDARWRWPVNPWGVSEVALNDVPVEGVVHSSIAIRMRGKPCLSVRQLETAARTKATYGGEAMTIVYDGPSKTIQLGDEHAQLFVKSVSGDVALFVITDRPGPRGCVVLAEFEVTRPQRTSPP
jgi:hypothetical protein